MMMMTMTKMMMTTMIDPFTHKKIVLLYPFSKNGNWQDFFIAEKVSDPVQVKACSSNPVRAFCIFYTFRELFS